MISTGYVPDRGDFVWVDLTPPTGHEQSGRRPAMVLSPRSYNRKTGLCVICPATRQRKGYAFEVAVELGPGDVSVVLADHVRNIDWRARHVERIRRLPKAIVEEVLDRLAALLFPDSAT